MSTVVDRVRADEGPGPADPAPVGLGPLGWARWLWRQLTSMRTALFLLLMLAVAAVPGSIVPQRGADAVRVAQYLRDHPDLGPWIDRVSGFDVYTSPWFSAIYLLLFVSLVGCVLPRTRTHLRALRTPPPPTPARLERLPVHRAAEVPFAADVALAAARRALRSRRYRVVDGGGASVAAQRGDLRETGNLLFHLALIGVLVAVAVGGLYGYRGQTLVPQGKAFANSLTSYDSFDPGGLYDTAALTPFSLRLDDLRVKFDETSAGGQFAAPRDFEADLGVSDGPGQPVQERRLRVNHPLRVGGASVYLAGNGYAPHVTVRDSQGNVAFDDQVPFLPQDGFYSSSGVIKVPDAAGTQLGFVADLYPTYLMTDQGPRSIFPDKRDPVILLTAFTGDLGLKGAPQNVYVLDTKKMTQLKGADGAPFRAALRPGDTQELPDGAGSITLDSVDRYAGITVRHDPARGVALVSALLAIAGLSASLFIPRRRLWVRVRPVGNEGAGVGTLVQVGALARSEDAGLAEEADRVLADLVLALPISPERAPSPSVP